MSDEMSDFATDGEDQSSDRSVWTLGLALLCLGLAAGAITALLMAPQSGKQLRKQLRRKYEDARDAMDDWSEQAGDWIERGSYWAGKASSGFGDRASDLADKASDWRSKASDWADKAKSRVRR